MICNRDKIVPKTKIHCEDKTSDFQCILLVGLGLIFIFFFLLFYIFHIGKLISITFIIIKITFKKRISFFLSIYLFIFREMGREGEKERNINVWLPLTHPLLGTLLATQACVLTGNQTSDPLVCGPVLSPLSHNSQGKKTIISKSNKIPKNVLNNIKSSDLWNTECLFLYLGFNSFNNDYSFQCTHLTLFLRGQYFFPN